MTDWPKVNRPKALINMASYVLAEGNSLSPQADAKQLLQKATDLDALGLATAGELDDETVEKFFGLVKQRCDGVPLQHILGSVGFRYVEVEVGPGVLVPRPETEIVVGWAIDALKAAIEDGVENPLVVDLGSGSGIIAKSIAKEIPSTRVVAVEISSEAVSYLDKNLADTSVEIVECDLSELPGLRPDLAGNCDLVISNPPYIPLSDIDSLPADVKADPEIALFSGEDGLDAIRALIPVAACLLKEGGKLVLEHGDEQREAVIELASAQKRFREVVDHRDLNHRPRFLTACRVRVENVKYDLAQQREKALAAAANAISQGRCVVLPTDTVYGIGADAFSASAVQSLLNAKHRSRDMPPPVLISAPQALSTLVSEIPAAAENLIRHYWPGALTVILPVSADLRMDLGHTNGTIAVRVPDNADARELLELTGPLAVSSANISGQPSATDADEALRQLADSVAVYLDGGPTPGPVPSTIVSFADNPGGKLIRLGAISAAELRKYAPNIEFPDEAQ